MAPQKFEFTDMSDSQTNLTNGGGKKDRGLYISPAVGLILVLLAAVVAVGVGIIVHFAGGNRDVICQCQASDIPGKPSAEAIKEGCLELAAQGDVDVCVKCSETPSTSRYTTSQGPINTPATTERPKVTDVRLPTSMSPLHYDVTLHPHMDDPDPEKFFFTGTVTILMRCNSATDNITLHINNLTISEHSFALAGASSITDPPRITGLEYDTDRQFLIVRLNTNTTRAQNYELGLKFSSQLKNDLHGLYYSQYTRDGKPVYLATTQFQPTDARKAFPCFDEPAIKANFSTTLIRPTDRISISNMPIVSSSAFVENGKTYMRDRYETTPQMSTYLLAFIVCDFNYRANVTKQNVTYRAYATPESVDQTPYSLQVGVDIIEYFEDYFQVKYPLPKQDMIAIPDFAAGAMENWGLITYRETSMLYKPGVSNEANKERIAIVVSHELAHQWFGNLVTPSWWDDLWLNEGFASFVEYLGVDFVHPEWRMFDKFVISDLQSSFTFDGLTSSHPVYVPVQHPDEINEIFDTISYAKGATIIRMMRHFLGSDTFQKGITNYLNKHQFSDAFHDDLWEALTLQAVAEGKSDINVKAIMDTWVLQMNYPVVTVTRHYGAPDQVEVTQERYLSDPSANDSLKYVSPFGYRWTIPLTFTSSVNPRFDHNNSDVFWMLKSEPYKIIDVSSTTDLPINNSIDDWILANVQQYGYYRVNYQVGNWLALAKQLEVNHLLIPIINRAQIINDAWNLAKSGHIGLDTALATIEYLGLERDYVPWYAARSELNFVESMLSSFPVYGQFQTFMQSTLNDSFHDFGLTIVRPEHVDVATQALIAGQACYYGIQPCLNEVSAQFAQWMTNKSDNPIDPNLKSVVYCNAISTGGWSEWNFTLQMYSEAEVASEKSSLLSALSCSKQPLILNHFMELTLPDSSPIRKQDAPTVISSVARNNVGRSLAWDFFRGNYAKLKDKFASSFFGWSSMIEALTVSFNTQPQLNEVKAFMQREAGNLGTGERAFNQALEKVSSNIKWMNKNLQIITNWLDNKQPRTG